MTTDGIPFGSAIGNHAHLGGLNVVGLKRRGFTPEQIRNIRAAFRVLYRSGLKLAEATAQLEALAKDQPELLPLVEFLPQASRGIVR